MLPFGLDEVQGNMTHLFYTTFKQCIREGGVGLFLFVLAVVQDDIIHIHKQGCILTNFAMLKMYQNLVDRFTSARKHMGISKKALWGCLFWL